MIPGLQFQEEYLNEIEQADLIEQLYDIVPFRELPTREPQSYVYGGRYEPRHISDTLPSFLRELCEKIFTDGYTEEVSDSVAIIKYNPGQSMGPHIDGLKAGKSIAVISLLSTGEMKFERGSISETYYLFPGSILSISGESRYEWTHEILPVDEERISVVFRKHTPTF